MPKRWRVSIFTVLLWLIGIMLSESVRAQEPTLLTDVLQQKPILTCSGPTHAFVGTDPVEMNFYGIRATLNTQNPALCGASHSDSSVWVMISSSPEIGGYAQVGYGKRTGQASPVYFLEFKKNYQTQRVRTEYYHVSGVHTYQVQYLPTQGRLCMYYDGVLLRCADFDPIVAWGSGWRPLWDAETHDLGDDVPGTALAPVYFSNLRIQKTRGGSYVSPSGLTISSDSSRYRVAWDTSDIKFHIWTQ